MRFWGVLQKERVKNILEGENGIASFISSLPNNQNTSSLFIHLHLSSSQACRRKLLCILTWALLQKVAQDNVVLYICNWVIEIVMRPIDLNYCHIIQVYIQSFKTCLSFMWNSPAAYTFTWMLFSLCSISSCWIWNDRALVIFHILTTGVLFLKRLQMNWRATDGQHLLYRTDRSSHAEISK